MSSYLYPDDFTSPFHPTIQNAAERSFWKIRRFTPEKLDPIGLRSCFNHLNRMQAMNIRTKTWQTWKSQTHLKLFSRRRLSSSELDMILKAFLMGKPGIPLIPIAQAWTTDLNGALAWTNADNLGCVQYLLGFGNSKDTDILCFSSLFSNFSHADKAQRTSSCSGTRLPAEKFCSGEPPVHGSDMWTWQNTCTSPSTDLVIVRSVITWFTRSSQGSHEHHCNMHGSLHMQMKEPWTFHQPPFHSWNGWHLLMKLKTRILDERHLGLWQRWTP